MTLLLIVAAAIGWWAWRSGQIQALRFGDVAVKAYRPGYGEWKAGERLRILAPFEHIHVFDGETGMRI